MGKDVTLIDSAKQVAVEVNKILSEDCILNIKGNGKADFFVSDNPEWFKGLAERFLGRPVKNVKKVESV